VRTPIGTANAARLALLRGLAGRQMRAHLHQAARSSDDVGRLGGTRKPSVPTGAANLMRLSLRCPDHDKPDAGAFSPTVVHALRLGLPPPSTVHDPYSFRIPASEQNRWPRYRRGLYRSPLRYAPTPDGNEAFGSITGDFTVVDGDIALGAPEPGLWPLCLLLLVSLLKFSRRRRALD
jgi:hypothetical protein